MLKRSPKALKVDTLGKLIIPSSKQTRDVIFEMKEVSKNILTQIAVGMAYTLINKKNLQKMILKMG